MPAAAEEAEETAGAAGNPEGRGVAAERGRVLVMSGRLREGQVHVLSIIERADC